MSLDHANREVEIKVAVPDLDTLNARLTALGYSVSRHRVFEANVLFDKADGSMRQRGELIRLRQAGDLCILTYKGRATVEKHKEREEIEVAIGDLAQMTSILERLGLVAGFRYEKYRTEWAIAGQAGTLMVDETPIGNYLELEGPHDWIDQQATAIGYFEADYVNLSYGRLYAMECQRQGVPPTHMLFPAP